MWLLYNIHSRIGNSNCHIVLRISCCQVRSEHMRTGWSVLEMDRLYLALPPCLLGPSILVCMDDSSVGTRVLVQDCGKIRVPTCDIIIRPLMLQVFKEEISRVQDKCNSFRSAIIVRRNSNPSKVTSINQNLPQSTR